MSTHTVYTHFFSTQSILHSRIDICTSIPCYFTCAACYNVVVIKLKIPCCSTCMCEEVYSKQLIPSLLLGIYPLHFCISNQIKDNTSTQIIERYVVVWVGYYFKYESIVTSTVLLLLALLALLLLASYCI